MVLRVSGNRYVPVLVLAADCEDVMSRETLILASTPGKKVPARAKADHDYFALGASRKGRKTWDGRPWGGLLRSRFVLGAASWVPAARSAAILRFLF